MGEKIIVEIIQQNCFIEMSYTHNQNEGILKVKLNKAWLLYMTNQSKPYIHEVIPEQFLALHPLSPTHVSSPLYHFLSKVLWFQSDNSNLPSCF